MNLFVLCESHSVFNSFCHDYRLREHFGSSSDMRGQVQYLAPSDLDHLRGRCPVLVLVPEGPRSIRMLDAIHELSEVPSVVVVDVPECQRFQAMRREYKRKVGF